MPILVKGVLTGEDGKSQSDKKMFWFHENT